SASGGNVDVPHQRLHLPGSVRLADHVWPQPLGAVRERGPAIPAPPGRVTRRAGSSRGKAQTRPVAIPRGYAVTGMTATGAVVGCAVPPAGSTVMPSRSPGRTPAARSGTVEPELATSSRPAERA